jgi:hypothetical protein
MDWLRRLMLAIVVSFSWAAAACSDKPDEPEPEESTGAEIEEAAEDTGDAVEEGAEDTGEAVEEAAEDVDDEH